jgi:hypothetical protein
MCVSETERPASAASLCWAIEGITELAGPPELRAKRFKPRGRAWLPQELIDLRHFDADRVVVECFNGILKQTFRIVSDIGMRCRPAHVGVIVVLCVALRNRLTTIRILSKPEYQTQRFERAVPVPQDVGTMTFPVV